MTPKQPGIDFRILGRLEIRRGHEGVEVAYRRARLILGVLLLEAGRLVPVERLIELSWFRAEPPRTARNAVQVAVSNVRNLLQESARIVTVGDAYALDVPPGAVDAHRFRASLREAKALDAGNAARLLREADEMWRGPVLLGTFDDALREYLCASLEE